MFIINCERDHSYCQVDDSDVIFDKDCPPQIGEDIMFFFNNKKENGRVVMISDCEIKIKRMLDMYKKKPLKRKLPTPPPENSNELAALSTKRQRKINSKYSSSSFENLDLTKPLKDHKNKQKGSGNENKKKSDETMQPIINEKEFEEKSESVAPKKVEHSPSKDELKKMLMEAQAKIKSSKHLNATTSSKILKTLPKKKSDSFGNISSTTESDFDDSREKDDSFDSKNAAETINNSGDDANKTYDDDDKKKEESKNSASKNANSNEHQLFGNHAETDVNDPDLYGKDWPEESMIKLISQVYCKKSYFDSIKSLCNQASHVVRRLIPGVFKPSGYMNTTFSGQAPRAHKGQGKPAQVKALNDTAKNEIIDFALKIAAEKNWTGRNGIPQTREDLKKVMSQRIGELKREIEINNKKQASVSTNKIN
ncbi:uncharacterized protein LOC130677491 [Microplitis mediator]|uniref:uncharacterized protein LOC130677491 n=1 Tax=Microplitis mediator TaxID=375433 RepID=UPI002555831D|nr:uncharacterized protein LOC130677491 [Microplitis mediator]